MYERNREKVIEIIKKLQEFKVEKGCSPAEAAHAASKITELLEKHQLTLVDVASKTINEEMLKEAVHTGRKTRNPGEAVLAMAVAVGCDCQVISDHDNGHCYNFLGYASDVQVAVYLFTYLRDGLMSRANAEADVEGIKGAARMRWRNNFLMGASGVIRSRLLREKQERHEQRQAAVAAQEVAETKADQSTSNGGVMSLVHLKAPKVKEFVKQTYKRLTTSPIKVRSQYSAIESGRRAGREIELRPGVESKPVAQLPM
jgi:hypothetical protein